VTAGTQKQGFRSPQRSRPATARLDGRVLDLSCLLFGTKTVEERTLPRCPNLSKMTDAVEKGKNELIKFFTYAPVETGIS
jgi:hypothetical protein